jgi:hypothetical protein
MNLETTMNAPNEIDTYDRGIVPAETAARKEREGANFKQKPPEDSPDSIDTTAGYTVDKEGLLNNYAVEPEMYYEVPGDARAQEEAEEAQRAQELAEVNDTDETGKLTEDGDRRGKGTGVI